MRIFNLCNFIFESLVFILFCSHINGHGREKSKVLLLSFDGFRHDYFDIAEKFGIDLKSFKKVFKIGFKANYLNNVFLTRTFPNHMTIITGCYEETHGIINNIFFDPIFNETFSYKNITQSLQSKWFSNSEPLWVTNMLNGYKSAVFYWPGQLAAYKNHIHPTYSFGAYHDDIPLNYKFDLVLKWLSDEETTLGIMYHPEPDRTGHKYGPNSKEILTKLKQIDNSIQYLLTQIESRGLTSLLNVIIVSDHGMATITNSKRVIMDDFLDPNLYHHYREASYAFWGIWPKTVSNTSVILHQLKSVPHVTVYRKEDIPKEWNYANNRRVAPIVVLAEEGWAMVHNRTNIVYSRGAHGYAVSSSQRMLGVFIAWGPDIVASNRSSVVVRAVDVFPLISEILKFNRIPNHNGSLLNVRWMLNRTASEAGVFTSLVIICSLSLITVLSACIMISCAHYNANALRVQKVGNTYVLKSGNLVRKWQEKRDDLNVDKNTNSYKYKKSLNKKAKVTDADAAFLLESNDEDEILGDIQGGSYKFNS